MALINCPECGKEASDKAEKCPNCAYPFITEEPKEEKKSRNNRWVVPVAIIIALMFIAGMVTLILLKGADVAMAEEGVQKENVSEKAVQIEKTKAEPSTKKQKKSGSFEEIITADVNDAIAELTAEYDKVSAGITDYAAYKGSIDSVSGWYAYCAERSSALYWQMLSDCYDQYSDVADKYIDDYGEWTDMLSDAYDVWNDGMGDYYDAWNDLCQDMYRLLDDVISDANDWSNYDEISDAWEDMYDMYSDAWEELYDLYSDAWSDLYDFYSDVWGELYDDNADLSKIYEKLIA